MQLIKTLQNYKAHHFIFWVVYYCFWVWVYESFYADLTILLKVTFVYLIAHASSYYATQYILIPKILRPTNFFFFAIAFITLLLLLAGSMQIAIFGLLKVSLDTFGGNSTNTFVLFFTSMVFMSGLLLSAKFLLEVSRSKRKNEQLKKEQLESELQYLKAQMNPHFLFNAINSVYVLIKKDPDTAADILIKLSDLLRSQLYEFTEKSISIDQELAYIENYIALERIRRGDRLAFEFKKCGNLTGFHIAPLMLMPFLENCFKHLSSYKEKKNIIRIDISFADGVLHITFFNTTELQNKQPEKKTVGGIGLRNIKRRLELIYPKRHTLDIRSEEDSFSVKLTLNVYE